MPKIQSIKRSAKLYNDIKQDKMAGKKYKQKKGQSPGD
jgi:hypothetical protein